MILAISQMDPTVQGIFYLIATVLFVVAGVISIMVKSIWSACISFGLAFVSLVFMWNAFAAS